MILKGICFVFLLSLSMRSLSYYLKLAYFSEYLRLWAISFGYSAENNIAKKKRYLLKEAYSLRKVTSLILLVTPRPWVTLDFLVGVICDLGLVS